MEQRRRANRKKSYLFVRFLQVLHQDSHDHVDQYELSHQNENDEKDGGDDVRYTAVLQTVGRRVAVLAQRVFHDSVPVITRRHTE